MNEFGLDGREFIPLCDLLKKTGLCASGGFAKTTISEGNVKVNGEVELRKRYKTRVNDIVEFDGSSYKVIA